MKKLVCSVLCGLIAGLAYIVLMFLVTMPFLLLIRMGFLGLPTGGSTIQEVISNMTGTINDISANLDSSALVILLIQTVLFVALEVVTFIFMKKVVNVFLADSMDYFHRLYNGVFVFVFLVPETLIILATFFNFPLIIALALILCITILIAVFVTLMAAKVLPDLAKNQNRKYLLKTSPKE